MASTRRILLLLFLISGVFRAGLLAGWARLLAVAPGPGLADPPAALAAILLAAAAGSILGGLFADRSGKHPLAVHGLLEIGIGLAAVLSPVMVTLPAELASSWGALEEAGPAGGWAFRFVAALAGAGLPAAMMGASLPILSRVTTLRADHAGWTVGSLHTAALAGLTAGAGLFFFRLLPGPGLRASIFLLATGSLAVGLLSLEVVRRWWKEGLPVPGPVSTALDLEAGSAPRPWSAPLLAGGAGLAAGLILTAWSRVLGLVLGPSVQARAVFAVTAGTGLSLGALIGARLADRQGRAESYGLVAGLLGGAALAGHATFLQVPQLPLTFALAFHGFGLGGTVPAGSPAWALRFHGIQLMISAAAVLPVCVFLGTVFPVLARIRVRVVGGIGSRIGSLQAWGLGGLAAGAAAAPLLVLPAAGLRGGILAGLVAALAVAAAAAWTAEGWRPAWRHLAAAGALGLAVFVTRGGPPWDPYVMSSGVHAYATDWLPLDLHNRRFASILKRSQILEFHEEGRAATVLVSRDTVSGSTWMAVDGLVERDSRLTLETALLLGHLPLLHLPSPPGPRTRVACVGCGAGMIPEAILSHRPGRLVIVQPEPEVIRASSFFLEGGGSLEERPVVRVIHGGGRGWLGAAPDRHDAILLAPGASWAGPPARLATREALEAARDRLRPGGVAALWVPAGWMDPAGVRIAFRTFAAVFSRVKAFMAGPLGDIILLGSEVPIPADPARMAALLEDPQAARPLRRAGIRSVEDFLTYHLMNGAEARAFAGEGIIHTDDNALLELAVPLTAHTATPEPLRRALGPHAGDPLEGVESLPGSAASAAEAHERLALAFMGRGRIRRAVEALRRSQELQPSPAREEILEDWQGLIPQRERR